MVKGPSLLFEILLKKISLSNRHRNSQGNWWYKGKEGLCLSEIKKYAKAILRDDGFRIKTDKNIHYLND